MANRNQILEDVFVAAIGNSHLTLTGVAQTLHRQVPEVKTVSVINAGFGEKITYSVLFHDRQRSTISLHRLAEHETIDQFEGEREVSRPIDIPKEWSLDVALDEGQISLQ